MNKQFELKLTHLDFPRIIVTEDFINENKFILKEPKAIYEKMKMPEELFSFAREVLINYSPWEYAEEFRSKEYMAKIENKEIEYTYITDIFEATQDFLDYIVFAWGKALDQRGLSAGRSISKLSTYLWLFNREDLCEIIEDDNLYYPYGMPALLKIAKLLKIEPPEECHEFLLNYKKNIGKYPL